MIPSSDNKAPRFLNRTEALKALSDLWSEHDGTHFYKDEFIEFFNQVWQSAEDRILQAVVEKIEKSKCEVPPEPMAKWGKSVPMALVNKLLLYVGRFNYNKALSDLKGYVEEGRKK